MTPIIVFGSGGHSRVVLDALFLEKRYEVKALVSLNPTIISEFPNVPHISEDNFFSQTKVFQGVVAIGDNRVRKKVVEKITTRYPNFQFISVIHPEAFLSSNAQVLPGSVLLSKASVQIGCRVGSHCLLNTSSSLDHDGKMGDFSSLGPGAILGGEVEIGRESAIGLGVLIKHQIRVGDQSVVGMGSVVMRDVESSVIAYGNPCRLIRERQPGEKYL